MIAQLSRGLFLLCEGVWLPHRDRWGNPLRKFRPDDFDPRPRTPDGRGRRPDKAAQRAAFFARSGPLGSVAAAKAIFAGMGRAG